MVHPALHRIHTLCFYCSYIKCIFPLLTSRKAKKEQIMVPLPAAQCAQWTEMGNIKFPIFQNKISTFGCTVDIVIIETVTNNGNWLMFQPIPTYETNAIQLHFFSAVVLISVTVVWLDLLRGVKKSIFSYMIWSKFWRFWSSYLVLQYFEAQ